MKRNPDLRRLKRSTEFAVPSASGIVVAARFWSFRTRPSLLFEVQDQKEQQYNIIGLTMVY